MPYTQHGHWYGPGEPTQPGPALVARCGGPGLCEACAVQAGKPLPPLPPKWSETQASQISETSRQQIAAAEAKMTHAQSLLDQATDAQQAARAGYTRLRSLDPASQNTDQTRNAWGQAMADWVDAQVELEQARDELAALHAQALEEAGQP